MTNPALGLQDVADQLGVHYQTVYRWVRSGQLPAALVSGRYEIPPEALARFTARRARPQRPSPRRPRGGFGPLSERMFGALANGDEREATHLARDLVDDGVPLTEVVQDVLSPALRRIGREWSEGGMSVAQEHRASRIVERILGEHLPTPRGRRRGTVVVAAVAGEQHSLPTLMAAVALRDDNWHVIHLGADVPTADLRAFCQEAAPDLVVLTATEPGVDQRARRVAAALRGDGHRVLVGRPGDRLDDLQQAARDQHAAHRADGA